MEELEEFAAFCGRLELESGRRMRLEPFQAELLADYFAGAQETLALLPKKNGKSTLMAALALWHLLTVEDAECLVAAASRDQATILYEQAAGFVERSSSLLRHMRVQRGYRMIRARDGRGRIRVLAADVDTADGVIPTLAFVDELHRHKSLNLYGVFRDGLGPRRGQMLTISTAGDSEASALGEIRAAARSLEGLRREGRHTVARSADGGFVLHEWALDREDDRGDMRVVKMANPASWQTEEALRRRYESPSMLPAQWARFACGLWQASEDWWLRAEQWAQGARVGTILPGERIALGFDGSRVGDSTGLVACRLEDALCVPLAEWAAPEGHHRDQTWEVPALEVDAAVAQAMNTFRVVRGYFDPPLWQSDIERWGLEFGQPAVTPFHTARSPMMAAVERFRTDLLAGEVGHNGDPRLTRAVMNARMHAARGGYFLVKDTPMSPNKIDLAVAAVLAYEARCDALASDSRPGRFYAFS